ncbi:hypothetical protein C9374_004475 [Naegleria lovaniensis]|uniref:Potassium channel domain-containing protein n=1 Tax=Naegleria lovaniensis TaxID=51637 RepID=A0AA88GRG2_NAELO|nr:uncharacterized protein C9374_004475 [Naegleria lovaniensis]KAG2383138.1 hypothetical protein C9374_004475 [Naegleria lovaniensis]
METHPSRSVTRAEGGSTAELRHEEDSSMRDQQKNASKGKYNSDHHEIQDHMVGTSVAIQLPILQTESRSTEDFEAPYYSLADNSKRDDTESDMIELKTMSGATTSLTLLKNYFFSTPNSPQNLNLEQEGSIDQSIHSRRERRLTLRQLTTPTNPNEKYCVVSQCYFPNAMFSKNHFVNYENLEMFKFVLTDVEDIEEYLAEFYETYGYHTNEADVTTNLYVCDNVFSCIFNRHEYALGKYKNLIKYFGLIDIATLHKRMKSYQLSCRDFITNCLWIMFMSVTYLLFIALLCISIWLVEGGHELELLRNTTISSGNVTASSLDCHEDNLLRLSQPLFEHGSMNNSALEPIMQYSLTNLPKWNYLSSFYFTSTTMLTIGYGDYSPSTPGGQFLVVVFAFFSLFLTTLVITAIGERFLSNTTCVLYILSHTMMRIVRFTIIKASMRNKFKNISKAFTSPFAQLVYLGVFILIYILIGSLFFYLLEDSKGDTWTFGTAIYFAVVTLTTIGYGDIYVQHEMSKLVLVVFVLFGVGFLAVLFTKLIEVVTPAMTSIVNRKTSKQKQKLIKEFKDRHQNKSP